MAKQWRGVIREYWDRLDVSKKTPVITLGEGGTPLIPAPALSEKTGLDVWVKFEGMNPTGSFKDRGMTMAISKAMEAGAKAVICASTGNTSASAAAYAAWAGITSAVLVPDGKIAMGKLSQAVAHNSNIIQIEGNFDDCLEIARELAENYPIHLVNSVNNDRIEGQKTASFEIVDVLGRAPDYHFLPVGNAGNYTAYHRGYTEDLAAGRSDRMPRMFGFQAAGSAPIVAGARVMKPETIASAIRIGNPASWDLALAAQADTDGYFGAIDDAGILDAHRLLSQSSGIFVEPSSAISIAGLMERSEAGVLDKGATVVCTVTGHGLKDPSWALKTADGSDIEPTRVPVDAAKVAEVLGMEKKRMSVTIEPGTRLKVVVPATTANLGPGFDTLGMALTIYDELIVESVAESGVHVEVTGVGAGEVPTDETNLVARSLLHALAHWGVKAPGLRLVAHNSIPHGRGVGSSGAAIVAGVVAAQGLIGNQMDISDDELLRVATEIEGHPDNIAPSLFGGMTIAWVTDQGPRSKKLSVHRGVSLLVAIPESSTMSTQLARSLQPDTVPHEDAIFNLSRASLLIAALLDSPELLFEATEDRLHQNYRASAMPETEALIGTLRDKGYAAVVSGAGPSILVLCSDPAQRAEAEALIARHQKSSWHCHALTVDERGATVEGLPALAD